MYPNFRYATTHASWPNQVEIWFSIRDNASAASQTRLRQDDQAPRHTRSGVRPETLSGPSLGSSIPSKGDDVNWTCSSCGAVFDPAEATGGVCPVCGQWDPDDDLNHEAALVWLAEKGRSTKWVGFWREGETEDEVWRRAVAAVHEYWRPKLTDDLE